MADDPSIIALRREIDAVLATAADSLADQMRKAVRQGELDLRDMLEAVLADAARAAVAEMIRSLSESQGATNGSPGSAEMGQILATLAARGRRFS